MQYLLATSSPTCPALRPRRERDEQFGPSRADPAFPRRPGEARRQGLGVFRGRPAVDRTRPRARARSRSLPAATTARQPAAGGASAAPAAARLRRLPCALPATRSDRLLRHPTAGLAGNPHLSRRAALCRCRLRRRPSRAVPRRTAAPRHHYRAGVRHGPCGIRRGILPGRAEAPPADDRRQGADGPQRAAGAVRYRGQWLRREPRADRALARQRAPAIRGHPALRADLLARATGRGGAPAGRVSRRLPAHPSSENLKEVAWVGELFPQAQDYLDVYHRAGLVGERSVFAHGIHLSERECRCLAHKNAALAHCPSSNLFIGSGLFDLGRAQQYGIRVGIGSDVGGGTSLSLLANLADAYKIQQLRGTSPIRSRRSTWPPSAAPGRSTWTAWSVTSCPAARPTSSPSTWPPRR